MALQLPGRPQIYQADPFDAFRKSYDHTKGIVDESNGNEAFGKYADDLYGRQPSPQEPPAKGLDFLRSLIGGTEPMAAPQAQATAPASPTGGADPVDDMYLRSIRAAESGGNDAAKNPASSATGRYQFTSGTWNDLMNKQPGLGLTADGRTDPAQQERAIRAFTADNAKALSGSGIPVNPGNLYAAHFLGAGGASTVLRGQDNAPVSAYVGPEVVAANPFLADMTVGDFKNWSAQKGGGQGGGYSAPQSGVEGIPQATGPKYTLPPRETMIAMFKSPDTRPIAVALAQGAQQGQNATTLQTFNRPDGSIWQFNPATGEIDVVQDALDRQAKQAQIDSTGVPSGYRRNAGGALEAVPGGPADPANPLNAKKTAEAPNVQTRYNPATGQEEKVQWNSTTSAWEPFGGQKAPSNGLTVTTNPDGTTTVQQGGTAKPLTEGQSKDTVFVTRAKGSLPIIDSIGNELTDLRTNVTGQLPVVGNYTKSPQYQQAEQAGTEFLQAILRKDTGAAITPQETDEYGKVYLPRPGDSPELLGQKKASRNRAVAAIEAGLPPQAILNAEKALLTSGSAALPPTTATDATQDQAAPVVITDDAGYDALPSGATFQAPDGTIRKKP